MHPKAGGRRSVKAAALAAALSLGVAGCAYNEELGRNQLMFGVGEDSMAEAGSAAWQDIKEQQTISRDSRYTERLNRVAPRLLRASGEDPAEWEYLVFEDPTLNAFALPGKKIGIHTGIMDIMQNDAQLAAVVGHEIAHVEYNHAGERSSQNLLAQLGLVGTSIALGSRCGDNPRAGTDCSQNAQQLAQVLGVGAMYGLILPYSRKHELEADAGGVRYMARAGYDASEALEFWTRMAQASANQERPAEFASTHPATETRIENLRREIAQLGQGT
ncbi:M48 family metallopeptidase [Parvularcula oceani]|uniref:M48 family metallopeptidase n=1 Tax=Parvularcula oceani TaxID=1247963 RepID=UPI000562A7E5|nr:M48 family metallopeptidase [Parvularcula oceani]